MIQKQNFRFLLILAAFLCVESATRPQITEQYRKTFLRLKDVCDQKYNESTRKNDLLYNESRKSTDNAMNQTQTRINLLSTSISDQIKLNMCNLTCCRSLLYDVGRLSTFLLNLCMNLGNLNTLIATKSRFSVIATVSVNTIQYCLNLNPLDTQDESYKRCLLDKLFDLNDQINLIEQIYDEQSKVALAYTISCLTQKTANMFMKLDEINLAFKSCTVNAIGVEP